VAKDFSLLQNVLIAAESHSASYSVVISVLCLG